LKNIGLEELDEELEFVPTYLGEDKVKLREVLSLKVESTHPSSLHPCEICGTTGCFTD
jgi:hypothetical protein